MNENINLCEILKDCPKGTKLYSCIYGEVVFIKVDIESRCPICVITTLKSGNTFSVSFTKEGYADEYYNNEECILFPSKDQRDWSKWQCPKSKKQKFDPKILKPFDRVIVKPDNGNWHCAILSHQEEHSFYYRMIDGLGYANIVPYNDDTKHLVGTTVKAPEYYRYWED